MYKRIISDIESKDIKIYLNNSLSFVSVRINDLLHLIWFFAREITLLFVVSDFSHEQDLILLEETSFHQFSNMPSPGLKKMFSQQFFYTQNVCRKIFSFTILIICLWLVVLPYM